MAGFMVNLADAVILNGETESNAVHGCDDAEALTVIAPVTVSGTITIQVSSDPPSSDGGTTSPTFRTLQSGGSDITLPAGKGLTITDISFRQLKMVSSTGEGAARTFKISKQFYT